MTFGEIEEREKLRAEAFSSKIEREILEALYNFRDINPLRPKDFFEHLPSNSYPLSGSKLAYHLDKLCRAGLVKRKRVGRKLTWYTLMDEGIEFYEKLPKRRTTADVIRFLVGVVAPYAKGVSEDIIYETLRSLIERGEASSAEPE